MSHLPVNHPLRPAYRFATALGAVLTMTIGTLGAMKTADLPLFDQGDHFVLKVVRVNLGHSLLMLGSGLLLLVAALIGRNVDRMLNMYFGGGLMVVGLASLVLMRTEANVLNYRMPNVAFALVLGTLLLTAGLYGKVAKN